LRAQTLLRAETLDDRSLKASQIHQNELHLIIENPIERGLKEMNKEGKMMTLLESKD
jgi:hypothetical protein